MVLTSFERRCEANSAYKTINSHKKNKEKEEMHGQSDIHSVELDDKMDLKCSEQVT